MIADDLSGSLAAPFVLDLCRLIAAVGAVAVAASVGVAEEGEVAFAVAAVVVVAAELVVAAVAAAETKHRYAEQGTEQMSQLEPVAVTVAHCPVLSVVVPQQGQQEPRSSFAARDFAVAHSRYLSSAY